MTRFLLLLVIAGGLAAAPARAQSFDLSAVEALFSEEPRVEVNLRGSLLRLVAESSREDDPDLARMIDGLQGIFVRQYALSRARNDLNGRLRTLARSLEGGGWETLVRVREDDEDVYILQRPAANALSGLVVMSLSPSDDEATFVFINGRIDPAQVGRLGGRLGVEHLDRAGRPAPPPAPPAPPRPRR